MEGMTFGMLMNSMAEPIGEAPPIAVPPGLTVSADRLPAGTPDLAVPAEASPADPPVDRRGQAL
jgi:hypothetical protein